MKRLSKRICSLFLFLFFSSLCFGQYEGCECEELIKKERKNLSSSDKQIDIELFYPDGKIKYKEVTRGRRSYITCYSASGKKCKEIFANSRINVKKTIHYDANGKKYMVCKGSINY